MKRRGQGVDRHGRVWEGRVVSWDEAEAEDFRFWFEELTPEERVAAVDACLVGALKTRGVDDLPRLRRVSRVVKRK